MPTTEGGLDLKMNLTELLDGYPGHEHTLSDLPTVQRRRAARRAERHHVHTDAARRVRRAVGGELLVRAPGHSQ